MRALDYCGLRGVNKGEGQHCSRALSGRRKIAEMALKDRVIVLPDKVVKLHSSSLTRVKMTQPAPKIRIVSTAFGLV
jgi:hypothetical protein